MSTFNVIQNKANQSGGGIHPINSLITIYCDRSHSKLASIKFTPTDITKSSIYGGLLDRCTLNEYAEVLTKSRDPKDGR